MRVEIWSDVVCPWCYIARHRLDRAIAELPSPPRVELLFRSFELDPDAPKTAERTVVERTMDRQGISREEAERATAYVTQVAAADGLEMNLATARPTNTLDAHRLLQLAAIRQVRPALEERFHRAYFAEGVDVGDPVRLLAMAHEVGISEVDARRVLAGRAFTLQVRTDEQEARALDAPGVPFVAFDRTRTLAGARSVGDYRAVLEAPSIGVERG